MIENYGFKFYNIFVKFLKKTVKNQYAGFGCPQPYGYGGGTGTYTYLGTSGT